MGEGNVEYGKSVGTALKVVRQLHWDTMRLLQDFNGLMTEYRPVFGNAVTNGLSATLSAGFWMAEGVYRYYVSPTEPGTAHGITVAFEDYKRRIDEPLFLAACIEYNIENGQDVVTVCRPWDIWELFFDRCEERALGSVVRRDDPFLDQRAKHADLIAVPLYSIGSVEDAHRLLEKVRGTAEGHG